MPVPSLCQHDHLTKLISDSGGSQTKSWLYTLEHGFGMNVDILVTSLRTLVRIWPSWSLWEYLSLLEAGMRALPIQPYSDLEFILVALFQPGSLGHAMLTSFSDTVAFQSRHKDSCTIVCGKMRNTKTLKSGF